MKKNGFIGWLLLFAALGFIGFIGSHFLVHLGGWGDRNMAARWQNGGSQIQIFNQGGFHQGLFGRGHRMIMMGNYDRPYGIIRLVSIIVALIIAAIGWLLRKNAKGNMLRKWGGWILIAIGTLLLMKKVLPLVVFLIIGFVIWKFLTNGKKEEKVETLTTDSTFVSINPVTSKTGNFLDEWERKISKEEH